VVGAVLLVLLDYLAVAEAVAVPMLEVSLLEAAVVVQGSLQFQVILSLPLVQLLSRLKAEEAHKVVVVLLVLAVIP
jgi:hypothetical protein